MKQEDLEKLSAVKVGNENYIAEITRVEGQVVLANAMKVTSGVIGTEDMVKYVKKRNMNDLTNIVLGTEAGFSYAAFDAATRADMSALLVKLEMAQQIKNGLLTNIAFDHILGK